MGQKEPIQDSKYRILVLEGTPSDRQLVQEILSVRYELTFIDRISELKEICQQDVNGRFSLLICELLAYEGNLSKSFVCNDLSIPVELPFMVMSALDDYETLQRCFQFGALDYIVKPLRPSELAAKIENIIHRTTHSTVFALAPHFQIKVDPVNLTISNADERVAITHTQMLILNQFAKHNAHVTKDQISKTLWPDYKIGSKALEVHMSNLRKKLFNIGMIIDYQNPDCYILNSTNIAQPNQ